MKTQDPKIPSKPDPKKAREERLAKALRDNLRRRKNLEIPSSASGKDD